MTPSTTLIHNAIIVNNGSQQHGWVAIEGPTIVAVGEGDNIPQQHTRGQMIDAHGALLMPGGIDEHVHFRDPGLTHKADIATETVAAAMGGITSFIDMPNTMPQTTTLEAWQAKMDRAAQVSAINYGFYLGATNDNLPALLSADYSRVAGVKLFIGSSTGNMLVDRRQVIEHIFTDVNALIAVHAESETVIKANRERITAECGGKVTVNRHPDIRDRRACLEATQSVVELARATGARLHVLHISTADELNLFAAGPVGAKRITAETCPQYLTFDRTAYDTLGSRVKCNPAIKDATDRQALIEACATAVIDCVATDHAPHLLSEKQGDALTAVSGMPMIQFSLPLMLTLTETTSLTIPQVARLMAHNPARIYGIEGRGFIAPGCAADLALVERTDAPWTPTDADVAGRCGWTPLIHTPLHYRVKATWVNGRMVWNGNDIDNSVRGNALAFNHR